MQKLISTILILLCVSCANSKQNENGNNINIQKGDFKQSCEELNTNVLFEGSMTEDSLIKIIYSDFSRLDKKMKFENYLNCIDQKFQLNCQSGQCELKGKL